MGGAELALRRDAELAVSWDLAGHQHPHQPEPLSLKGG